MAFMAHHFPLRDVHVAAGAKLETVDDWEVPRAYGDPAAEYAAVRTRVGVIDRGDHGVIAVTGRDRATFLHALLSNEIKALGPGEGCAAALLDVHGKVQVLVRVWVLEERILLVTPPGRSASTLEALDAYLFSEKVSLEDASGEFALLLLAGPEAPSLGRRLSEGTIPADRAWAGVTATVEAIPVRLVRGGGDSGEPELWIVGPAAAGPALWEAAVTAGAQPVGLTAFESLRIETGTPVLGHDVDAAVLLPEIPFEHLLSYTKGCYPGQEVVVRVRDRGHVNRLLRGVLLEGRTVPPPGAEVVTVGPAGATAPESPPEPAVIGRVTSATWSLGLDRPIALAFVRRTHAEPGTRVGIRSAQATIAATVSALPFAVDA
jgi:folate-binding protein YgfZ